MLTYTKFFRKFVLRRLSDFNKIHDIKNLEELPIGSILHVLDNFSKSKDTILLTPSSNNSILNLEPQKKLIYNITRSFNTDKLNEIANDIIITSAGVTTALNQYKQQNNTTVKYITTIDDFKINAMIQNIVNYNPLYRANVKGLLKSYKLFQYIFYNINEMLILNKDKQHLIHLPIVGVNLTKEDFIKTYKKIDRVTLQYSELPYYLFMVHVMNYLNDESDYSLFNDIPEPILKKTDFILTCNNKVVILNLVKLKELNTISPIVIKLLSTLNQLTQIDTITENTETVNEKLITVDTDVIISNTPSFKEPISNIKFKENFITNLKNDDAVTMSVIDDDETLTPAQKNKLKETVQKTKSIKLGNDTIEDILTKNITQDISDNKLDFLEQDEDILDKSMLESKVIGFDEEYLNKTYKKDIVSNLLTFNKIGLFVQNVKEEDEINHMNKLTHYTVTFQDKNFKTHTVKFTFPKIDKHGKCLINGNIKILKKQRVALPIVKISPYRVSLTTNYNKCIVEKIQNNANSFYPYILKMIKDSDDNTKLVYTKSSNIKLIPHLELTNTTEYIDKNNILKDNKTGDYITSNKGNFTIVKNKEKYKLLKSINPNIVCREYTTISKKLSSIQTTKEVFCFNYNYRHELIKDDKKLLQVLYYEQEHGLFFGYDKTNKNICYYIQLDGKVAIIDIEKVELIKHSTLIDILSSSLGVKPRPLNEYCILKLLSKNFPLIFILAYRFGLSNMLKYLNVNYKIYEKGEKVKKEISDISLKFANKTLIIPRVPLANSMIFSGFNMYTLTPYNFEEFNQKDVYYDLMLSKKMSPNLLKGIDSFYDLMIDPISRDVLEQMNEPTNVRDLLIRCVILLMSEDHNEPSACANFRERSVEQLPAIMYKELARAYSTYINKSLGSSNKLSIRDYEIFQKIAQSQLMQNVDITNPIKDIKDQMVFSHAGDSGRSADSFVIQDRKYPKDGIGIISEGTPDSGAVGFVATNTMNANLINTRGMTISKDPSTLSATETLSVSGLVIPGSTTDDKQYI